MKMPNWTKIKFVATLAAVALMGGAATLSARADNSPAAAPTAAQSAKQIMIGTLFLEAPATNADEIVNEITNSLVLMNPNSPKFHDFLTLHPEVKLLGAPRVFSGSGKAAKMVVTRPGLMIGTNSTDGITLDVTPSADADSRITAKIGYELRGVADGPMMSLPAITNEATLTFNSPRSLLVIRQVIPGDEASTVLVFVRSLIVQRGFHPVPQHKP